MKQKEITIEIKGLTNSGKSSLTYLIKELLKKEGININMTVDTDYIDENDFNMKMSKNLDERIEMLKRRKITIKNSTILKKFS